MALALLQKYDLVNDNTDKLRKETAAAIRQAADDIQNEDPGTTNHANRIIWSDRVRGDINEPFTESGKFMWDMVDNTTLASGIYTDNDVQFVVNSLIDTYATGT